MGYRIFNFYKFRTMFPGADKYRDEFAHLNRYHGFRIRPVFQNENDPRITRVGRISAEYQSG